MSQSSPGLPAPHIRDAGAADARGQGIGGALVREAIEGAVRSGCAEISVSTMADNAAAQRLYRAHGLTDESLLLERHL